MFPYQPACLSDRYHAICKACKFASEPLLELRLNYRWPPYQW